MIASIPGLSVVVIGRNEGVRLRRCLQSISEMRDPGCAVEVIYVDSASTDDSVELAKSMGAKVVSVRPVRPTAAIGRNAGWRHARSPFILFLDGDTILEPNFVAEAMPMFRDEQISVIWGHRREINIRASFYNRVLDLDWISPTGYTDYCGGDALIRRDVLELIRGYDENLIAGEEPEMCRRMRALGFRILHVDHLMTRHDLAMTKWSQYWKRATRTGYAYAEVSERFRQTSMPFWEYEARANRIRAILHGAVLAVGLSSSLMLLDLWPLTGIGIFYGILVLRTAVKMRWKSKSFYTLLLYGLHSHLQQLPIYWGQIQYLKDRRAGKKRGLIEYKTG